MPRLSHASSDLSLRPPPFPEMTLVLMHAFLQSPEDGALVSPTVASGPGTRDEDGNLWPSPQVRLWRPVVCHVFVVVCGCSERPKQTGELWRGCALWRGCTTPQSPPPLSCGVAEPRPPPPSPPVVAWLHHAQPSPPSVVAWLHRGCGMQRS